MLRGLIVSRRYKSSGKNKASKDYVVHFPEIDDLDKAKRLIGKEVEYRDGKLRIRGNVISTHGVRGKVMVRFRKDLPGEYRPAAVFLRLDEELLRSLRLESPSS